MPIAATGNLTLLSNLDLGSDKTFIVPAGQEWQIESVLMVYVSTATVGNRLLTVDVTDGLNSVFLRYVSGAAQTASLTMTYVFAPLHPQETTMVNNAVQLRAISDRLTLPAGYKLRVYDRAAIAAATDDMVVRVTYRLGSI